MRDWLFSAENIHLDSNSSAGLISELARAIPIEDLASRLAGFSKVIRHCSPPT